MEWVVKEIVGTNELQVALNNLSKDGYRIFAILNSETRRDAMIVAAFLEVK